MNQTLIIVPTYNERENLPRIAERLLKLPVAVDLLVVDDHSPDGTGKIADELTGKYTQIHVLHRAEKNGLGRAYIAGFKWALEHGYEFIFEMDCDLSPPGVRSAKFSTRTIANMSGVAFATSCARARGFAIEQIKNTSASL